MNRKTNILFVFELHFLNRWGLSYFILLINHWGCGEVFIFTRKRLLGRSEEWLRPIPGLRLRGAGPRSRTPSATELRALPRDSPSAGGPFQRLLCRPPPRRGPLSRRCVPLSRLLDLLGTPRTSDVPGPREGRERPLVPAPRGAPAAVPPRPSAPSRSRGRSPRAAGRVWSLRTRRQGGGGAVRGPRRYPRPGTETGPGGEGRGRSGRLRALRPPGTRRTCIVARTAKSRQAATTPLVSLEFLGVLKFVN